MKNEFIEKLEKLVAIESVSTNKSEHHKILAAVEFIKSELIPLGFDINILKKADNPPLIIAKKIISKSAKTIGVYAHYDVQPEDPVDKWESSPFVLTPRSGKLFGRGVADDKGHLVVSLIAAGNLIKNKSLKNNLVFIFEGEEELGSVSFEELIKTVDEDIKNIDAFFIMDMGMKAKDRPQIYYALRGLICFELIIKVGEIDLHSGVYGNRVLNPAQVLADLFAKMKDIKTGQIKIPGFYDKVKKVTDEEINLLSKYIQPEDLEKKNAKVKHIDHFLKSKISPSLDINGMQSGYTGPGSKTIIPASAMVKFSIRLVENQKAEEIESVVTQFVRDNLPKEVDYELTALTGSDPFYTDFSNPFTQKTAEILKKVFNNEVLLNRTGGTVAAAEIIQRLFKKPVILTGFTLPDESIHAPNENIDEAMFIKGISAMEEIINQ